MLTMFCLVSRQAMANVLPIMMYKPKEVVLFVTPEVKESADHLSELFRYKRISVSRVENLNAYDYLNFKKVVLTELEKHKNDVCLNVTGGTKLMALAAYEAFAEKDKKIIYCNTEKNEIIHLFPKPNFEKLSLELSIIDYLKSYGFQLVETKSESFLPEYQKLFEILDNNNLLQQFSTFLTQFRKEFSDQKENLKTYNDNKDKIFSIQKTHSGFILFVNKEKFKFENDKFLMGDWLEFYAFNFLKNLNLNPEVGVKITSAHNVENEIDIVFVKNYQLNLISCKSGNTDPNKFIYEIETLRQVAGGTFAKAHLLTSEPLTKKIKERAKELKINSFAVNELKNSLL